MEMHMANKIRIGWLKWSNCSGILRDTRVATKLSENFYMMARRLVNFYEYRDWEVKNNISKNKFNRNDDD